MDAATARAHNLATLLRHLPLICEPLRSVLANSPSSPYVPNGWYQCTLAPHYTEPDRAFSRWSQIHAPELYRAFLEADINLLCRDRKITTNDIRRFARVKYHLNSGQIAPALEIPSLHELLEFLKRNPSWTDSRYCRCITHRKDKEGHPLIYPHFHALEDQVEVRRTDILTSLYRSTVNPNKNPLPDNGKGPQVAAQTKLTLGPAQSEPQEDRAADPKSAPAEMDAAVVQMNTETTAADAHQSTPDRAGSPPQPGRADESQTPAEPVAIASAAPTPIVPTVPKAIPHRKSLEIQSAPQIRAHHTSEITKMQLSAQRGKAEDNAIRKRKERIAALVDNLKATEKWETIEGVAAYRSKVQKSQPAYPDDHSGHVRDVSPPQPNRIVTKSTKRPASPRHIPIDQLLSKRQKTAPDGKDGLSQTSAPQHGGATPVAPKGTRSGQAAQCQSTQYQSPSRMEREAPATAQKSPILVMSQLSDDAPRTQQEGLGGARDEEPPCTAPNKEPQEAFRCSDKWDRATKRATASTQDSQEDAHMPLPNLKEREARKKKQQELAREKAQTVSQQPLMATMRASKNDLTQAEKAYMRSLTSEKGGHGRFDYVPPEGRSIYRCPLKGCPNPYSKKGQPINSDGLRGKFHRHLARDHQDVETCVSLKVVMRDGTEQFFEYPQPKKQTPRRRYRMPQPTAASSQNGETEDQMEPQGASQGPVEAESSAGAPEKHMHSQVESRTSKASESGTVVHEDAMDHGKQSTVLSPASNPTGAM